MSNLAASSTQINQPHIMPIKPAFSSIIHIIFWCPKLTLLVVGTSTCTILINLESGYNLLALSTSCIKLLINLGYAEQQDQQQQQQQVKCKFSYYFINISGYLFLLFLPNQPS